MVNLRIRRPEVPARRHVADWPSLTDWERDFFAPFFAAFREIEPLTERGWFPRVDIIEKPDHWLFKADIPDVNPDDISVTVDSGVLTIKGERKFEEETREGDFTRFERQYGAFERRFSLPSGVDESSVKAGYKNGVLTVSVQKKEEAKPKSVKIDVQ